ncbi:hypothetical protein CY35_06G123400 [Sphagnum magellanicum]|nr:hypothetical protein CY35_06G123400 [Sphagnum magellanicum]
MAPKFLVLARKAIVEALDLTSGKNEQLLKLNKRQCQCVAQKLSEIGNFLKYVECAAGSANLLERRDATLGKELYRVVTDALSLIKECRDEQWLRAAIRQRSEKSSEDFVEICCEVQWCTSVLCICLQSAIRKQAAVVEPEAWDGRLSVLDHFKLEAAANQDREDLKSSLKLLSQGHVCDASCARSKAEKCLAAQFFKRLDSRPTELAADRGSRSAEILPSLLWKVHYRDLPSVRKIGKGSFGEVQETKWLEDKYAKKVFPGADNKSFKQESEVLARLCHPNVVRVVGWSESRTGVNKSIVMELMQEDLFTFLENRLDNNEFEGSADVPLSILAAVDLMLQVARGLKYLHSRTVAHRDLKSMNVLVKRLSGAPELEYSEGYLNAKLADFGLSKTKNLSTRYSNQTRDVGTRKWMAPEVFEITKDKIDSDAVQLPEIAHPFKADVYSFALVCYEILTGEKPFETEKMCDLYKRVVLEHVRPKLPKTCPRRLVSLIRLCWDHDPLSRPDFPEICKELRYIKGLLLTDEETQALKTDILASTLKPTEDWNVEVEGPWGGLGGVSFNDGLATGIKGLKIKSNTRVFFSLSVEYDKCGKSFRSPHHGNPSSDRAKDLQELEIKFNYPNEYLQQIMGVLGKTHGYKVGNRLVTCVTSITFKTNIKTYGPYGNPKTGDQNFKSISGKILGFWGRSGQVLDRLGVFVSDTT